MLYLDYNATAPYSPSVQKYISEEMVHDWANASSEHDLGYELSIRIKHARSVIADHLDCTTGSLFFTSGATESINTILSLDFLKKHEISTVITSNLEHHAVLDRCKYLQKNGVAILKVENDKDGVYSLSSLERLCGENPGSLVSLLYVNNETGVINNLKPIVEIVRINKCLIHVDAVQALGKLEHSLYDLDVDFASYSGHKIGSLKGIGLLYAKYSDMLVPLIYGGSQERGKRAGTYNTSGIISFAYAIEDLSLVDKDLIKKNRDFLEKSLLSIDESFFVNGSNVDRVSNTTNICLKGNNAKEILLKLSREKIYVSTGSACSSGSEEPSHVLTNLGLDRESALSCLRVSIGAQQFDSKSLIPTINKILKS